MHVHILAARCDLETGKSLNIAPPGWQKTFGLLRDAFNHEHGWSRPDDPARARTQQPGHRAYLDAAKLRAGLAVETDPREVIRDYLVQRVEHGVVRDRADVVAALQEAGLDVPRQGTDYLTARDPREREAVAAEGCAVRAGLQPGATGRRGCGRSGRPTGRRSSRAERRSCGGFARAGATLRAARSVPSEPIRRRGPDGSTYRRCRGGSWPRRRA